MANAKNEKSAVFEKFLISEDITCFDKRNIEDEEDTVVYRSYMQTDMAICLSLCCSMRRFTALFALW